MFFCFDENGNKIKFKPTTTSNFKFLWWCTNEKSCSNKFVVFVLSDETEHSDFFKKLYYLYLARELALMRDHGSYDENIIDPILTKVQNKKIDGGGSVTNGVITSWSVCSIPNIQETPKEFWDNIMNELGVYSYK